MVRSPSAAALGPFLLERPFGRGGMGEVWYARHRETRLPVAVKVITTAKALSPVSQAAIRQEVRAAARLHHPGVVEVFEMGVLPDAVAELEGNLLPGSPYFVMEYIRGGSLKEHGAVGSWAELKHVLLALLDALAHAHARGVIHRDLKPANVLVDEQPDHRLFKLTDFGLAQAVTAETLHGETDRAAHGTPHYMAPEQISGEWRDHGPWSDLYALGNMTYALATGLPPFAQNGPISAFEAVTHQLLHEPPKLTAAFELPEGVHPWLEKLVAKDPLERYRSAPEAAYDLIAIDGEEGDELWLSAVTSELPMASGSRRVHKAKTRRMTPVSLDGELAFSTLPVARLRPKQPATPLARPRMTRRGRELPFPRGWRRFEADAEPRFASAGLGLFGLRQIPLVGRELERDVLWDSLARVHDHRRAEVVVIRGPTGIGKSALAHWMSVRAYEVGGLIGLRAHYEEVAAGGNALGRMLAQHISCKGLDRNKTVERCRQWLLDRNHVDAKRLAGMLTSVIHPPSRTEASTGVSRILRSDERLAVAIRFFEVTTRDRPNIVWLDDAQSHPDAFRLARRMLAFTKRRSLPALVVLTVNDDELDESGAAADELGALVTEGVPVLTLRPLEPTTIEVLVHKLLPLESSLTRQVVDQSDGNPLFAIQLVGDWVQRGLLQPGEQGFALREETEPAPFDLLGLWRDRIDVAASGDLQALTAWELLATLGQEVAHDEWLDVCRRAGIDEPNATAHAEILLRAGIIEPRDDRWAFAHEMCQQVLLQQANRAERGPAHHRHCAVMLADRYDAETRGVAGRRAQHLLAAGLRTDAVESMLAAAAEARFVSDFSQARSWLERRQAIMVDLDLTDESGPHARQLLQGRVLLATILQDQGKYDEADRFLPRLEEVARDGGHTEELFEVLRLRGLRALTKSELDDAIGFFAEAHRLCDELPASFLPRILGSLGDAHRFRKEIDRATDFMQRAMTLYDEQANPYGYAYAAYGLGNLYASVGRIDEARALLDESLARFEEVGSPSGQAIALSAVASVCRLSGDRGRACTITESAVDLAESLGHRHLPWLRLSLGASLLYARRDEESLAVLELATTELTRTGHVVAEAQSRILLACAHALVGDPQRCRDELEQGWTLSAEAMADADIAEALAETAQRLPDGRTQLAELLHERAQHAYDALSTS